MSQVFISHSKEDIEGQDFFKHIFGSVQHKAFWYSWEGPKPPHAQTLLRAIRGSSSMFVILSKPMENPHTRSWVGYEVGIAASLGKKVWVFEQSGSFIDVPVPFLTGYIQFPLEIPTLKMFPYYPIIQRAGMIIPRDPDPTRFPRFQKGRCAHDDCMSSYYRYILDSTYACPTCRRPVWDPELSEPMHYN